MTIERIKPLDKKEERTNIITAYALLMIMGFALLGACIAIIFTNQVETLSEAAIVTIGLIGGGALGFIGFLKYSEIIVAKPLK